MSWRRLRSSEILEDDMSDDRYNFDWFGNNRHVCDVLEDMRRCQKTSSYEYFDKLIEEADNMFLNMVYSLYEIPRSKKPKVREASSRGKSGA